MAVPLAIATIIFNNLGGLPFALFIIAAGLICMHEAYGLLAIWRPVAAVGFAAVVVMVSSLGPAARATCWRSQWRRFRWSCWP